MRHEDTWSARDILRQRQAEAERDARARVILDAERRAAREGTARPVEQGGVAS
jgi:hypothetical protein